MGIHLTETDPKKTATTFDYFRSLKEVREMLEKHASTNGTPTVISITVKGNGEASQSFEINNLSELMLIFGLNVDGHEPNPK
ncbi:hypothetical protein [Herbaspirillum rhizosphaerae]|uniref:hypothetical protein n=1 Tax=Herbaspirillum rhizosphaerae TaxID=346179 RepID=UPI000AAF6EA5|nr:hypothetical protein [Herbaspirillum rhizosphaerae]